MTKRIGLHLLALAAGALFLAASSGAQAQNYPTRPVRLIVGYGPGGVADITTRIIAQKLSVATGQQFIVDNKPGAGGVVAAELVAKAEPDGYSLLVLNNGNAISASLFKSLPYDPVKDFAPVSVMGFFDVMILVDKASPFKTVKDLIDYAKANPGKLNFAAVNIGSTQELSAELFKSKAGIDVTIVPFKTTPALITALNGGEIQVMFEIVAPVIGFIKDGRIRPLAVTAGERFAGLPDVPTVKESGLPDYEVVAWNGIAAPAKTPKAIVDKLNKEILAAVAQPDVKQKFQELGIEARAGTPEQLQKLLVSEIAKWGAVIKAAGIPQQ